MKPKRIGKIPKPRVRNNQFLEGRKKEIIPSKISDDPK
jgi:hypothetical protein